MKLVLVYFNMLRRRLRGRGIGVLEIEYMGGREIVCLKDIKVKLRFGRFRGFIYGIAG